MESFCIERFFGKLQFLINTFIRLFVGFVIILHIAEGAKGVFNQSNDLKHDHVSNLPGDSPNSNEKPDAKANSIATISKNRTGFLVQEIYNPGKILPNANLCSNSGRNMQLIIFITSSPVHFEQRKAIRETWGNFSQNDKIKAAFVVGLAQTSELNAAIRLEEGNYGDIIRLQINDSYRNLTLKTVSMFEWVSRYCSRVSFILKTDDDVFINIPRLKILMENRKPRERAIFGYVNQKARPIRNRKSKNYVTLDEYPNSFYPSYAIGVSYLVAGNLAEDMYMKSLKTRFLTPEDVFMTGIVRQDLKIELVNIKKFNVDTKQITKTCDIRKAIGIHRTRPSEQRIYWRKLNDKKISCQ